HDIFNSYVICHPQRDALAAHLRDRGIETFSHWWPPVHQHVGLNLGHCHLPVTEALSAQVLSLPIYPEMSDPQVEYVIEAIIEFCQSTEKG
ncbi:MAG: DegT/DnrJ/EryC1/StrS family aminotransferase, partial [Magnetococcales bacterium]|nr:DegT/DnrJ/EryC1/StrS family aminotransferase [Magnetococcales bacterium]